MKSSFLNISRRALRLGRSTGRRCAHFASLVASVAIGLSIATGAKAAAPTGFFSGIAFGTYSNLQVGPLAANLGMTALVGGSCVGTDGDTLTNSIQSLSVGAGGTVLNSGTVLSTTYSSTTTTSASVKNTSRISGLKLFNGLVSADAVLAVSSTQATAKQITSTDTGSTFVNLKIAGQVIDPTVAPNTRISLPGIGAVILKRETRLGNGSATSLLAIDMLVVEVNTANGFGLPIGANLIVSHAGSGFTRAISPIVLDGAAWAANVNAAAGDLLNAKVGRAAFVSIPCQGTGGATLKNSVASLSVGTTLSIGNGKTTAFGSGNTAKTTAVLQSINLLGGLISASSATAAAQTTVANGVATRSTAGSGFVALKVLGIAIPANVAANTKVALPGIGYVILNEQILPAAKSPADTVVNAIHIHVTTANLLGLPVGAEIVAGHASAGGRVIPAQA